MKNSLKHILHSNRFKILFLILSALLLSGCSGLIRPEQSSLTDFASLSSGHTVGQTFVAKYDGLAGLYFFLAPAQTGGDGKITLHLRSGPDAKTDLTVSQRDLAVDKVQSPGYYGFFITSLPDSNQKYYYAFLELTGSGEVQVGKAGGDTYLNGALYQDGAPADSQAAFQLIYARRQAFLGLGLEALSWAGILAVAFFLFVLPGWGLFSLLLPVWDRLTWLEKLGLSSGLSLALYPLLLVWTDTVGWHLGPVYAWLPPLLGLVMILWHNRAFLRADTLKRLHLPNLDRAYLLSRLPDLVAVVVISFIFLTRFWAIRSVEAPLWSDSVQHTAISQLIVDNGGLFTSWLPYAPYRTLTVQFGFPAFAALLSWISGLSSTQAILVSGQIINCLAVITILPLAMRLARGNRWAGIGALVAAGLISTMPAFYINWGRYAQLAGQAVLPVSCWLGWEVLSPSAGPETPHKKVGALRWAAVAFSGVILAGMALSYYRMAFYFGAFILIVMAAYGLPNWHFRPRLWVPQLGRLLIVALLAGLLFVPWALRLHGSALVGYVEGGISNGSSLAAVQTELNAWKSFLFYEPLPLSIIAGIGLVWSLFRRQWMVIGQLFWPFLLVAYMVSQLIRIPGANMIDTFSIIIACYIPVSLVVGWFISEIAGAGKVKLRQGLMALALLLIAAVGVVFPQRAMAQPVVYSYVTRPDTLAMAWIRENTPVDSRFLVEGVMYRWHTILGSDAGWWLPLLSGRGNTIPPQYALLDEAPIQPDYTQQMISLVENLQTVPMDSPQAVAMLCSQAVTHVYVGQTQGLTAFKVLGLPQLFPPTALTNSAYYTLVYHQDQVYVFALNKGACP